MITFPHPAWPHRAVRFYDAEMTAVRHLCDHVLAAPECHAWGLVEPSIAEAVDLGDPDARWRAAEAALADAGWRAAEAALADVDLGDPDANWRAAKAALAGGDPVARRLFYLYALAARAESADAARLRWHVSEGDETLALGTSGVLLVVEDDVLRTAFVPGKGNPARVRPAGGPTGGALRREGGMRSGRPGRPPRDERAHDRRRDRWSPEEHLYYDVFRPAVQHVRRSAYDAYDMEGRRVHRYGLLSRALPPMSGLKFDQWKERRALCREV